MQKRFRFLGLVLLAGVLHACSAEPSVDASPEGQAAADNNAVKQRAKSIDEAADQAVKLIEEDAKSEMDATKAEQQ